MNFKVAFREISLFFELSGSETVLFTGVPEHDLNEPSTDTVREIANRFGLFVTECTIDDVRSGNANLPALLETKNGSFWLVLAREDGTFFGKISADDASRTRIALDKIDLKQFVRVYSFKRIYKNDNLEEAIGRGPGVERGHWLFSTAKHYWRSYVQVIFASLFINSLAIVSSLFVMNVYDRVLPNEAITTLWVLAIGVTVAFVFDFALKYSRALLIDYTGKRVDLAVSSAIYQKIMNTPLSENTMQTGEYASKILQYETARDFFTSNSVSTLVDSCFIFIFVFVIYVIAGPIAFVPAIAVLIVLSIGIIVQMLIGRQLAAAANEAAMRQSLLIESITTAETLKLLRAEGAMLQRWRNLSNASAETSEQIKAISAFAVNSTQFVQQMVTVSVILLGAYLLIDGQVTTGAIVASVLLAGRAVAPLSQIAMTLSRLRQALLALKIVNQVMNQPEEAPNPVGFVNRTVQHGDLAFDKVEFRYPGADQASIDGVSFSVKAGERVGIIGRIGSGKTTIGRLIARLYLADEGRVLLDGVDIRQYHPAEVRAAVAIAGQTSDLLNGSLKDNLLLAKPDANDNDLVRVCKEAGVDSMVARHPSGFDMPVGENGSNLSSGQKQAVTVARLLLSEPKIVFLDEPTGAMDLASERLLLSSLQNLAAKNVTLIIATHRYSALNLVDRLIVLDDGKLLANGPKDAVIERLRKLEEKDRISA